VVVSNIWSALPAGCTFAGAVAVKTTFPPETAAGALDARVTPAGEAAGRMDETGMLGWTDGLPVGAPALFGCSAGSLQAAGVLSEELVGQGVWPSGVEAVPGATFAPWLVRQDAPTPDAGQGADPSGRLI